VLVRAGLAHVQFETIHPFLCGNGRDGRLLVTLLMCRAGVLCDPLLYLSLYLKQHRREYHSLLDGIRREDGGLVRRRAFAMRSRRGRFSKDWISMPFTAPLGSRSQRC